jgi:hypothetical protein
MLVLVLAPMDNLVGGAKSKANFAFNTSIKIPIVSEDGKNEGAERIACVAGAFASPTKPGLMTKTR